MKYKLNFDKNYYLTSFIHTETEEDEFEIEPTEMKLDYLNCYKLVDDEIIFDKKKYHTLVDTKAKNEEIARLKQELSSTDYQIIKCSEYQLQGLKAPYDIAALHTTRQALRDRINELEAKI